MTILEALRQTTTSIRDWVESKLSNKADIDGTIANAIKATKDNKDQDIASTYVQSIISPRLKLEYKTGDGASTSLDLKTAPIFLMYT